METKEPITALKGGEFVIKNSSVDEIFIPEQFNEEQLMIRGMVNDFVNTEIMPNIPAIEKQKDNIVVKILDKAAELGLLGTHMPEQYGGMQMDSNTNTLINLTIGRGGSALVSYAAHTGIGMLPLLYFGTDYLKEKYLPKLITGELKAAYCLTEPTSGSDALSAKTTAMLTDDGKHYIINGQKMWITNAGFADVFTVFAQEGGDKFTGFIVDRNAPGITYGAEEDKLGIKGSSTRQVFFENVKIPKENLLGEIGKGHLIAFNVLNIGRFKLGLLTLSGAIESVNVAANYANERIQFKVPISSFGAIKYKLAEQAIRCFTAESTNYRVSNMLQLKVAELKASGVSYAESKMLAAEEYAIECSIIKVHSSEVLDYVVDETVQVLGGIGFSEEFPAARAYRDARINKIFEGTNEINRLLIVDMLLKRAMKGKIDIVGPAWAVQKELSSMPSFAKAEGTYGAERTALANFKKIILMVAGAAAKKQMDKEMNLQHEQEILMNVADIMIDTFAAESLLLRVEKLAQMPNKKLDQSVYDAVLKVVFYDFNDHIAKIAKDAIVSFNEGDMLKAFLMGVKRFTKYPPINIKEMRRVVAEAVIKEGGYPF